MRYYIKVCRWPAHPTPARKVWILLWLWLHMFRDKKWHRPTLDLHINNRREEKSTLLRRQTQRLLNKARQATAITWTWWCEGKKKKDKWHWQESHTCHWTRSCPHTSLRTQPSFELFISKPPIRLDGAILRTEYDLSEVQVGLPVFHRH